MVSYCLPKNCTNYKYKHQMVDVKISLSFLNNGKIKNRKGEKWYHSSIYLYKNKQSISSRKYKISYCNKTQSKLNNYHLNFHYESCYITGVHLKYFIRKPNICFITWYYSSLNIAHSYFFVKRSDIFKHYKENELFLLNKLKLENNQNDTIFSVQILPPKIKYVKQLKYKNALHN